MQAVENAVFADKLPSAQSLASSDFDSLLDARDSDAFATPWTAAYHAVSKPYPDTDPSVQQRIDKIREHVYKRVYRETKVSDFASYVSDDFDMVLRYLVIEKASGWINVLWLTYGHGEIPSGTLIERPGDLANFIISAPLA